MLILILTLPLSVLIGWTVWTAFRHFSRNRNVNASPTLLAGSSRETATLNLEPTKFANVPAQNSQPLTPDDERQAFETGHPILIRYEDSSGTITERVIEIYRPGEGEMIFTWCRRKRAPRAFIRRNILNWRLLPERFDFDPIVAQFWDEEGIRERLEKNPWRRWLKRQPKEIADRYK